MPHPLLIWTKLSSSVEHCHCSQEHRSLHRLTVSDDEPGNHNFEEQTSEHNRSTAEPNNTLISKHIYKESGIRLHERWVYDRLLCRLWASVHREEWLECADAEWVGRKDAPKEEEIHGSGVCPHILIGRDEICESLVMLAMAKAELEANYGANDNETQCYKTCLCFAPVQVQGTEYLGIYRKAKG
jgi:hypothetical protein